MELVARDDDVTSVVCRHIAHAIRPFRPKTFAIETDFDIDFRRRIIKIYLNCFAEPAVVKIDDDDFYKMFSEKEIVDRVGREAGAFFASIYTPPPDTIKLGEN